MAKFLFGAWFIFVPLVGPGIAKTLEARWKRVRQLREPKVDLARERALAVGLLLLAIGLTVAMACYALPNALIGLLFIGTAVEAWRELRKLEHRLATGGPPEAVADLE